MSQVMSSVLRWIQAFMQFHHLGGGNSICHLDIFNLSFGLLDPFTHVWNVSRLDIDEFVMNF